jgi:hypothetical protein
MYMMHQVPHRLWTCTELSLVPAGPIRKHCLEAEWPEEPQPLHLQLTTVPSRPIAACGARGRQSHGL